MENLSVLVVGGHPADVFDHCGGTLAHHVRRGDKVTCVALTHGLRIHDVVIAEQLRLAKTAPDPEALSRLMEERSAVKQGEVIKACGILGITDVRFLDYDDIVLRVTDDLIQRLAAIVVEVRPQVVVTHFPLEDGGVASHHGNAGRITMYALSVAGNIIPGSPAPPHRVSEVFFMSPEMATFASSYLAAQARVFCDYYVDITDTAELKVRALDAMRSQQYAGNYARKTVEVWNGKDGHYMGVAYAEGFVRNWPEIGNYLPVSRERLDRANEPESQTRARTDVMIAPFVDLPD